MPNLYTMTNYDDCLRTFSLFYLPSRTVWLPFGMKGTSFVCQNKRDSFFLSSVLQPTHLRQHTLLCCLDNVDRIRYTDNEGSVGGQCAICATLFPCGRLATFIRGSRVWSFIFGVTMVSCRRQAAFFFCDSYISIPSLENFTLCA